MKKSHVIYIIVSILMLSMLSCHSDQRPDAGEEPPVLILEQVGYPQAILHDGRYYFTMQSMGGSSVKIFVTDDLTKLSEAHHRTIWSTEHDTMTHIWSPEIYHIDGKWYVYFEADDGNTDNHHIFVMECSQDDPMTGTFTMKGAIETHAEWNYGIHPSLLQLPSGQLYLVWSGWPKRRNETETQCIYIARMENPWTTSSERVMISRPEYEWERQWINPDGNRSAYPIYVNENPEAFLSPDGHRVIILYSASGLWTEYTALGMLTAPAAADLLDPSVWTKREEPVLLPDSVTRTCISDVYLVPSADGEQTLMLYELKRREQGNVVRDTYMRPVGWSADGEPIL